MADYEACSMSLQARIDKEVKELEVYGNLKLVIYQLRGEWENQDSRLFHWHDQVFWWNQFQSLASGR